MILAMKKTLLVISVLSLVGFVACSGQDEPSSAPSTPPASSAPSGNLNIKGKVTYAGAAKNDPIKMNADPVCLKENSGKAVANEVFSVGPNKGLGNVFVYIKEGAKPSASTAAPVTLDQKGCLYHPRVLGIQVGQTLRVVNSDPTMHNVNAQAKVNSGFNLGMPTRGQVSEKKFTKPEVMIRFKCDVHGWMGAWVGVVDHPHFMVTDSTGVFTLNGLPPGEYTIEAWHEKLGTKSQKVNLAAGATPQVDIAF